MATTISAGHGPIPQRTVSAVALAAVAAVAVSACGGSSGSSSSSGNGVASKPPAQMLSSAVAAGEAAKSLHVQGALNDNGQALSIDLAIEASKGASGTVSEGPASFKLIDTGGYYYLQPSKAFLLKFVHTPAAVQLLEGKWLKASPSDASVQSFGQLTSIKALMGSLTKNPGTLTKGSTSTVDGQKAIALHSSKGGTVYIATTGQPYPLQVSKASGGQTGKVTISQYNKSFAISAPSSSINIDRLSSGG